MVLFVARCLLALPLIVAPWLNGACDPRYQPLIVLPVAIAALLVTLEIWRGASTPFRIPQVVAFVLLGIVIGGVQLLPTSPDPWAWARTSTSRTVAPDDTDAITTNQAGNSTPDGATNSDSTSAPRSVYPLATRRRIAWLTVLAAYLILAANIFNTPEAVVSLFRLVVGNGCAIAIVGVIHAIFWNGHFMWVGPELSSRFGHFGPMVYRNQAANYLGMSMACWLGLYLFRIRNWGEREKPVSTSGKFLELLPIAILVFGILGSMSRGGAISALVATGGAAMLIIYRGGRLTIGRALLGIGVVIAGVVAVGLTDISSDVLSRTATVMDERELAGNNRWSHWSDAVRIVPDHWPLGVGIGAYGYFSPTFAQGHLPAIFRQAHNEYLQALVEGGVGCLAAVVLAAGFMVVSLVRRSRKGVVGQQAVVVTGLAAIVFQACHSLLDFCVELPVNIAFFALLCGVSLRANCEAQSDANDEFGVWSLRQDRFRRVTGVVLLLASVWAANVVCRHAAIDVAMTYVPWRQSTAGQSMFRIERAVRKLERSLHLEPEDADVHQALGEMYVMSYRLQARDELAKQLNVAKDDKRLWSVTAPSIVFGRAKQLAVQSDLIKLEELRQQDTIQHYLVPALRSYERAIAACPTLSLSHLRRAELFILGEEPIDDRNELDVVYRLDPGNVTRLFHAGQLYLLSGDLESAANRWRTCLEYSPRHLLEIVQIASTQADAETVAQSFLPDNLRLVWRAAEYCRPRSNLVVLRAELLKRALELIDSTEPDDGSDLERRAIEGMVYSSLGRYDEGVEILRTVTRERPSNAAWRFELSKCYQEMGNLVEAIRECQAAVRLKPSMQRYARKLEQLGRQNDKVGP